jgi:hypothetical protein
MQHGCQACGTANFQLERRDLAQRFVNEGQKHQRAKETTATEN